MIVELDMGLLPVLCAEQPVYLSPNFLTFLRSPGIDSLESIPPAYVAWRAGKEPYILLGFLAPANCPKIPALEKMCVLTYCKYVPPAHRRVIDKRLPSHHICINSVP